MRIIKFLFLFAILLTLLNFANAGNTDECAVNIQKASEAETSGNFIYAAQTYNDIGFCYATKSKCESAEKYYLLSVKNFKSGGVLEQAGVVYHNIGNCYSKIENHNLAAKYYALAGEILEKTNKTEYIALSYFNAAEAFNASGDLNNATNYYELSAKKFIKINDSKSAAIAYFRIAEIYFNLGACDNVDKYYKLFSKNYKKYNLSYDDSWIDGQLKYCKKIHKENITENSSMHLTENSSMHLTENSTTNSTADAQNKKDDEIMGFSKNLIIFGVFSGVLFFAIKSSLGCGMASLRRKEIFGIASLYFIISMVMGLFLGKMHLEEAFELLMPVLAIGVTLHILISILLLGLGYYTMREWINKKSDVSKKTFWIMALPCPACISAMFLSCSILVMTGIEGIVVGFAVGIIFFITILVGSFGVRKIIAPKPTRMGSVMIFFGLFYISSILLIPSYIQVEKMNITATTAGMGQGDVVVGLGSMMMIILISFLIQRIKK